MKLEAVCSFEKSANYRTKRRSVSADSNLHSNLWKNLKFNATFLKFSNIIQHGWFKFQLPEEDINHCQECHWKTHSNALYKLFKVISINIKVHKARSTCNVIAHGCGYVIYTLESWYRMCIEWNPPVWTAAELCRNDAVRGHFHSSSSE
jgi:hypothetical protein